VRVDTACTGEVMAQAKKACSRAPSGRAETKTQYRQKNGPKKKTKNLSQTRKISTSNGEREREREREREPCFAMKEELLLLLFVIECKCFDDEEITTSASEASQDATQDSLSVSF